MSLHLLAPSLCCGLVLLAACARDDRHTPSSVTPPPATQLEPDPSAVPSVVATGLPATAPQPDTPPVESPTDAATIIEVDVQAGPLDAQLVAIAARASKEGRVAAVELWAGWCEPCKKFDRLVAAGTVSEALRGAILIRVDVDMFDDELTQLGFTAPQIPSLYRVDGRGRPKGKPLQGGDWARRSAPQISAALDAFLHG